MNAQIIVFLAVSSIATGVFSLSGYGAEETRARASDHAYFDRGYDATPSQLVSPRAVSTTAASTK